MPFRQNFIEKRRFVRHPVKMPIEYQLLGEKAEARLSTSKDLSTGGISFLSIDPPPVGSRILVCIPNMDPPFQVEAVVIRLASSDQGYEVGVAFETGQAWFRARLVEQVCYIETWRQEQEALGRTLSFDEAAREWIDQNADSFFPAFED